MSETISGKLTVNLEKVVRSNKTLRLRSELALNVVKGQALFKVRTVSQTEGTRWTTNI